MIVGGKRDRVARALRLRRARVLLSTSNVSSCFLLKVDMGSIVGQALQYLAKDLYKVLSSMAMPSLTMVSNNSIDDENNV